MAYLLVYVDDIILTASSAALLQRLVQSLCREFSLSQAQYTEDILERAGMANCKPASTPVDAKLKLSAADGEPATDATFYRSITGALQYLTLTRPDIAYAVNQACLYMHCHRATHWTLVKRILKVPPWFHQ